MVGKTVIVGSGEDNNARRRVTCDMEFLSNPGSSIGESGDPPLGTDCWLCIEQCVTTCVTQVHQLASSALS